MVRRRAVLRLLVELLLAGVHSTHSVLLGIVRQLAAATGAADFQRGDGDAAQASLSLLTTLAKAGREELLGLPHGLPLALAPGSLEQETEGGGGAGGGSEQGEALAAAADAYAVAVLRYEAALAQRYELPPEAQQQLRAGVERCFEVACEALLASHAALLQTEADNARVLNNRGDLPEEAAAAYEAQRRSFEGLQRTTASLAEVLDAQLPELRRQAVTRMAGGGDDAAGDAAAVAAAAAAAAQVFEDEETRAFYESLVDLRAVVPAVLLGGAAEGAGKAGKEGEQSAEQLAEGGGGSGDGGQQQAGEAGKGAPAAAEAAAAGGAKAGPQQQQQQKAAAAGAKPESLQDDGPEVRERQLWRHCDLCNVSMGLLSAV